MTTGYDDWQDPEPRDLNEWRDEEHQMLVEDLLTPEADENPGFHA